MTSDRHSPRAEELRALGIEPDRVVDQRDVEYMLGAHGEEQQAVVCTLLGYRYPDTLAVGSAAPELVLHPIAEGAAVPLVELHRDRPLILFFGSYT